MAAGSQTLANMAPALKDKYVGLQARGRRKRKGLLGRMAAERTAVS